MLTYARCALRAASASCRRPVGFKFLERVFQRVREDECFTRTLTTKRVPCKVALQVLQLFPIILKCCSRARHYTLHIQTSQTRQSAYRTPLCRTPAPQHILQSKRQNRQNQQTGLLKRLANASAQASAKPATSVPHNSARLSPQTARAPALRLISLLSIPTAIGSSAGGQENHDASLVLPL